MKVGRLFFSGILIFLLGGSCTKTMEPAFIPTGFTGTWTLAEIYGNDSWGAPAYWKTAVPGTYIAFTSDGKYYRKNFTDSALTLVGTYKVLSDSSIEITQNNPASPAYPSYILYYNFSKGGYMTWGIFGFEALIKEKFRLNQ